VTFAPADSEGAVPAAAAMGDEPALEQAARPIMASVISPAAMTERRTLLILADQRWGRGALPHSLQI
jgi:hypothetical protein